MSLTPIYDDLLREFEGIISASEDVRADADDEPATGTLPEDTLSEEPTTLADDERGAMN